MNVKIACAVVLCAGLLTSCSSNPPAKAATVDVTGTVTLPNGQPARDVTLLILPTSASQSQNQVKLGADGKFSTKLIPGKYTFAFEGDAGLRAIPAKYHSNQPDNAIEVPDSGGPITIKLTN